MLLLFSLGRITYLPPLLTHFVTITRTLQRLPSSFTPITLCYHSLPLISFTLTFRSCHCRVVVVCFLSGVFRAAVSSLIASCSPSLGRVSSRRLVASLTVAWPRLSVAWLRLGIVAGGWYFWISAVLLSITSGLCS